MESSRCSICWQREETRHLPLFVNGSEGVEVCSLCESGLVDIIRMMVRTAGLSRKQMAKDMKEVREAKEKEKRKCLT